MNPLQLRGQYCTITASRGVQFRAPRFHRLAHRHYLYTGGGAAYGAPPAAAYGAAYAAAPAAYGAYGAGAYSSYLLPRGPPGGGAPGGRSVPGGAGGEGKLAEKLGELAPSAFETLAAWGNESIDEVGPVDG